jgi:hypothetical protein
MNTTKRGGYKESSLSRKPGTAFSASTKRPAHPLFQDITLVSSLGPAPSPFLESAGANSSYTEASTSSPALQCFYYECKVVAVPFSQKKIIGEVF